MVGYISMDENYDIDSFSSKDMEMWILPINVNSYARVSNMS